MHVPKDAMKTQPRSIEAPKDLKGCSALREILQLATKIAPVKILIEEA